MEIKERNISYEEAVSYIESTPKFTSKNSLEHTRRCLALLGNPEKCFRIIHVAGTNGKGSTCAFLDSVLRCAGYSCGLFTSPHLVRINERFVVNGVMIRDEEFLRSFRQVMEMVDQAGKEGIYFRKGRTSRSRNVSREKGFVQLRPERPDRNCFKPPDACSPRTEPRSSM